MKPLSSNKANGRKSESIFRRCGFHVTSSSYTACLPIEENPLTGSSFTTHWNSYWWINDRPSNQKCMSCEFAAHKIYISFICKNHLRGWPLLSCCCVNSHSVWNYLHPPLFHIYGTKRASSKKRSIWYIFVHIANIYWLLCWDWNLLCWFFISLFIFIYVILIIVCSLLFTSWFFSVCEGSLGLSILVSIIRSHGNDYFQSYNVLQC